MILRVDRLQTELPPPSDPDPVGELGRADDVDLPAQAPEADDVAVLLGDALKEPDAVVAQIEAAGGDRSDDGGTHCVPRSGTDPLAIFARARLARGATAVPDGGMGRLGEQLAAGLPADTVRAILVRLLG
jgi:hypothetical protein